MDRFWRCLSRLIAILTLGLSVQFCGSSVGTRTTQDSPPPPPALPSFSAATYDASGAKVEAAEQKLAEQGFKFALIRRHGKNVLGWDRNEVRSIASERADGVSFDDRLELLVQYANVLADHVARFGRGYYREQNGHKVLIKATDEPLRSLNEKLHVVNATIAGIKNNSVNRDDPDSNDAAPTVPPANADPRGSAGRVTPGVTN